MIRNRSQKFWDIYQGYLLTFEQGDTTSQYCLINSQEKVILLLKHDSVDCRTFNISCQKMFTSISSDKYILRTLETSSWSKKDWSGLLADKSDINLTAS